MRMFYGIRFDLRGFKEVISPEQRALVRRHLKLLVLFDPCTNVDAALAGRLDGGYYPYT